MIIADWFGGFCGILKDGGDWMFLGICVRRRPFVLAAGQFCISKLGINERHSDEADGA